MHLIYEKKLLSPNGCSTRVFITRTKSVAKYWCSTIVLPSEKTSTKARRSPFRARNIGHLQKLAGQRLEVPAPRMEVPAPSAASRAFARNGEREASRETFHPGLL
ncbi:unnamed protein product [Prorocentrum cordatum]|uniref:Uncharacterized protein n=1 Tax=Prorocentrum cordatum TaxID=2364126 RepID=A0ABN9P8E8_9DINO|nr:unnamed protein product [Polarella glacialis]